jgi:hypothetical protein
MRLTSESRTKIKRMRQLYILGEIQRCEYRQFIAVCLGYTGVVIS